MLRNTLAIKLLFIVTVGSVYGQETSLDWPWWRGPGRNGIAVEGQDIPTKWSESENVIWKAPVPGRGHSSPTVVGEQIYLATANESVSSQSVVAYARKTGKKLWETELNRGGFPRTHPKNTHGTCSVAYDDGRLFVAFHHRDKVTLYCLDTAGKKLWQKVVGKFAPRQYEYGYAPSPVIYKGRVIASADYEGGGFIACYDRDGKQLWKTARPRLLSFSSPVVANVAGKDQLLISGCEAVASYEPQNGKLNWAVNATTMATCGTVVWDGDLVFASGGYPKPQTVCVKADGSKKIVWSNNKKCYEQSMLAHNGYIYALTDRGLAYCWRAEDGREMWRARLEGPVSASPILVGDNIFVSVESGRTFVFKADPKRFTKVSTNKLGDSAFATPSVCGNRMYLRVAFGQRSNRQEFLYCIGKAPDA